MLKSVSRCGALVICGSAIALTASVLPAQAATTGWRADTKIAVKGKRALVSGVAAVSANDAWAVGAAATSTATKVVSYIEHWTGKSWRRVALPSKVAKVANSQAFLISSVAASSRTNVWVIGEVPAPTGAVRYLHFNGKTWTTGKVPGTTASGTQFAVIATALAIGKSSVWVLGAKLKVSGTTESESPYAAEFNGHSWTTKSVPGSSEISAASAVSAGNIWAVEGTNQLQGGLGSGKSSVVHWNGTSWKAASQPTKLPAGATLSAVSASANAVWIAGSAQKSTGATTTQFVDKMTGSTWAAAPTDLKDSANKNPCGPGSLVPDGHGGLWALGLCSTNSTSQLWHFTGGKSSAPTSPKFGGSKAAAVQLAQVPGTASIWAVGIVQVGKATDGLIGLYGPTP
jgi:hypothetical protein